MQLSISVRIAEGFLSKEIPIIPLAEVARIARGAGYSAICMRASQVGIRSSDEIVQSAIETLSQTELKVSMVTGDFDIVYNNELGPDALRNIGPYLDLAKKLDASLVRVALKSPEDIVWAQRAADQAAELGIRLAHQCHTLSLFETVQSISETLKKIGRSNFGLIYEPANLELCGQDYGLTTIDRLAPWIFNVYFQNQVLHPSGTITLETWCRGPVSFRIQPIHATGGVDFPLVLDGLRRIGYAGFVTVHQSATEGETPDETATRTAEFLYQLL